MRSTGPGTTFSEKIIEYAVANATVDLPDILIDQEVEVMHDEFRSSLARQGLTEDAWQKATEKTEVDLHTEFRPGAENASRRSSSSRRSPRSRASRSRTPRSRRRSTRRALRYADQPRLVRYFESDRGRNFIRSTLRRTKLVEELVDRWLAAHPDHPRPAAHRGRPGFAVEEASAQAAASIDATDPGTVMAEDVEPAAEPASAAAEPLSDAAEPAAEPAAASAAASAAD